jgi:integrase
MVAMGQTLTQSDIDNIRIASGRQLIKIDGVKGLYLDVRPGGKSWRFRSTDNLGKFKAVTVGDAEKVSLATAKDEAIKIALERQPVSNQHRKTSPTFNDFLHTHYIPYARATKRSAEWEEIIFKNHLLPTFGTTPLDEITKVSITKMIQEKVSAGYKPGTVNRILANLKTVLSKAVEWEIGGLEKNAAKQVKALKDPPHLDRFLSPEEAERLITAIQGSESAMLKYIIPFLLLTGARKREALDAQWKFIDFDQGIWTIPVTKSGRPRHVPLSPQAIEFLKTIKKSHKVLGISGQSPWIFPNPKSGKPYVTIFHSWDRCRRDADLADVRIHDLRHSFASALVNRGMTLYDVKEVLGHSNISTTQRYAHLSPGRLKEAVEQASEHYALKL